MTWDNVISGLGGAIAGVVGAIFARRKNNADAEKVEADAAKTEADAADVLVGVSQSVVKMLQENMATMKSDMNRLRQLSDECTRDRLALHAEIRTLRKQVADLQTELMGRKS